MTAVNGYGDNAKDEDIRVPVKIRVTSDPPGSNSMFPLGIYKATNYDNITRLERHYMDGCHIYQNSLKGEEFGFGYDESDLRVSTVFPILPVTSYYLAESEAPEDWAWSEPGFHKPRNIYQWYVGNGTEHFKGNFKRRQVEVSNPSSPGQGETIGGGRFSSSCILSFYNNKMFGQRAGRENYGKWHFQWIVHPSVASFNACWMGCYPTATRYGMSSTRKPWLITIPQTSGLNDSVQDSEQCGPFCNIDGEKISLHKIWSQTPNDIDMISGFYAMQSEILNNSGDPETISGVDYATGLQQYRNFLVTNANWDCPITIPRLDPYNMCNMSDASKGTGCNVGPEGRGDNGPYYEGMEFGGQAYDPTRWCGRAPSQHPDVASRITKLKIEVLETIAHPICMWLRAYRRCRVPPPPPPYDPYPQEPWAPLDYGGGDCEQENYSDDCECGPCCVCVSGIGGSDKCKKLNGTYCKCGGSHPGGVSNPLEQVMAIYVGPSLSSLPPAARLGTRCVLNDPGGVGVLQQGLGCNIANQRGAGYYAPSWLPDKVGDVPTELVKSIEHGHGFSNDPVAMFSELAKISGGGNALIASLVYGGNDTTGRGDIIYIKRGGLSNTDIDIDLYFGYWDGNADDSSVGPESASAQVTIDFADTRKTLRVKKIRRFPTANALEGAACEDNSTDLFGNRQLKLKIKIHKFQKPDGTYFTVEGMAGVGDEITSVADSAKQKCTYTKIHPDNSISVIQYAYHAGNFFKKDWGIGYPASKMTSGDPPCPNGGWKTTEDPPNSGNVVSDEVGYYTGDHHGVPSPPPGTIDADDLICDVTELTTWSPEDAGLGCSGSSYPLTNLEIVAGGCDFFQPDPSTPSNYGGSDSDGDGTPDNNSSSGTGAGQAGGQSGDGSGQGQSSSAGGLMTPPGSNSPVSPTEGTTYETYDSTLNQTQTWKIPFPECFKISVSKDEGYFPQLPFHNPSNLIDGTYNRSGDHNNFPIYENTDVGTAHPGSPFSLLYLTQAELSNSIPAGWTEGARWAIARKVTFGSPDQFVFLIAWVAIKETNRPDHLSTNENPAKESWKPVYTSGTPSTAWPDVHYVQSIIPCKSNNDSNSIGSNHGSNTENNITDGNHNADPTDPQRMPRSDPSEYPEHQSDCVDEAYATQNNIDLNDYICVTAVQKNGNAYPIFNGTYVKTDVLSGPDDDEDSIKRPIYDKTDLCPSETVEDNGQKARFIYRNIELKNASGAVVAAKPGWVLELTQIGFPSKAILQAPEKITKLPDGSRQRVLYSTPSAVPVNEWISFEGFNDTQDPIKYICVSKEGSSDSVYGTYQIQNCNTYLGSTTEGQALWTGTTTNPPPFSWYKQIKTSDGQDVASGEEGRIAVWIEAADVSNGEHAKAVWKLYKGPPPGNSWVGPTSIYGKTKNIGSIGELSDYVDDTMNTLAALGAGAIGIFTGLMLLAPPVAGVLAIVYFGATILAFSTAIGFEMAHAQFWYLISGENADRSLTCSLNPSDYDWSDSGISVKLGYCQKEEMARVKQGPCCFFGKPCSDNIISGQTPGTIIITGPQPGEEESYHQEEIDTSEEGLTKITNRLCLNAENQYVKGGSEALLGTYVKSELPDSQFISPGPVCGRKITGNNALGEVDAKVVYAKGNSAFIIKCSDRWELFGPKFNYRASDGIVKYSTFYAYSQDDDISNGITGWTISDEYKASGAEGGEPLPAFEHWSAVVVSTSCHEDSSGEQGSGSDQKSGDGGGESGSQPREPVDDDHPPCNDDYKHRLNMTDDSLRSTGDFCGESISTSSSGPNPGGLGSNFIPCATYEFELMSGCESRGRDGGKESSGSTEKDLLTYGRSKTSGGYLVDGGVNGTAALFAGDGYFKSKDGQENNLCWSTENSSGGTWGDGIGPCDQTGQEYPCCHAKGFAVAFWFKKTGPADDGWQGVVGHNYGINPDGSYPPDMGYNKGGWGVFYKNGALVFVIATRSETPEIWSYKSVPGASGTDFGGIPAQTEWTHYYFQYSVSPQGNIHLYLYINGNHYATYTEPSLGHPYPAVHADFMIGAFTLHGNTQEVTGHLKNALIDVVQVWDNVAYRIPVTDGDPSGPCSAREVAESSYNNGNGNCSGKNIKC